MKVAAKWKLAALTLVAVPAAIWLVPDPLSHWSKALIAVAFMPLFIALGIELRATWKRATEHRESYVEGSPTGNKLAVALAVVLIGLVLWAAYSVVHQHT